MATVNEKTKERCNALISEFEKNGIAATPVTVEDTDGTVIHLVATRKEKQANLENRPGGRLFKTLDEVLSNKSSVRWLVPGWLERGVIVLLVGPRNTFKSFFLLDRLMRIALNGDPVAIISAEGRGIDRRVNAWLRTFAPDRDASELKVHIIERRLNLYDGDDLAKVRAELEIIKPVAVGLDTFSKLVGGLDENDNSKVRTFIGRLDNELKRPLDCTVIIAHHSGHVETGRARGASSLGADTDCEFVVRKNPNGKSITITRERFKDSPPLDPVRFDSEIINLGYTDTDNEPVTSLVLRESDVPVYQQKRRPGGRQGEVLKVMDKQSGTAEPIEVTRLVELVIDATPSGNSSLAQRRSNVMRAVSKLVEHEWLFMHPGDCVSLTTASIQNEADWLSE